MFVFSLLRLYLRGRSIGGGGIGHEKRERIQILCSQGGEDGESWAKSVNVTDVPFGTFCNSPEYVVCILSYLSADFLKVEILKLSCKERCPSCAMIFRSFSYV